MKKLILAAVICMTYTNVQANVCEIPLNQVAVGSMTLMQSLDQFKKIHSNAKPDKDRIQILDVDQAFENAGVTSVGSIDFDPVKNRIIGFTLSYNEGKYARLETPLNQFKNSILKNSKLPQKGWVLSQDKEAYQYRCNDYQVFIRQDHGVGRGSLGAVVWVFSRYSDSFE